MDEEDEEDQRDHHHRNLRTERHQVARETAGSVTASPERERESNTDSSERKIEAAEDNIEYVDLMCLYTNEALQAECRHMKGDANCEQTYKSVDVIKQMEMKCSHGVQKTVSSL